MGHNKTWSVISIKDNRSQLDDIENEGERWTGGKLQHSGLITKVERGP